MLHTLKPLPLLLGLLAFCASALAAEPHYLPRQPAHILREGAVVARLELEIARSWPEKQHGLMFRTELPEQAGMLFIYSPPMDAAMWMKNTLIPLDMLFIDAENRIVHIHADATPHSLEPISANRPVGAVLELSGGAAARLGIRIGDSLSLTEPQT